MRLHPRVRAQWSSIFLFLFFALYCRKEPSVCETSEGPLPEEMVIIRAQPSVFKINLVGDTEITYPGTISFRSRGQRYLRTVAAKNSDEDFAGH